MVKFTSLTRVLYIWILKLLIINNLLFQLCNFMQTNNGRLAKMYTSLQVYLGKKIIKSIENSFEIHLASSLLDVHNQSWFIQIQLWNTVINRGVHSTSWSLKGCLVPFSCPVYCILNGTLNILFTPLISIRVDKILNIPLSIMQYSSTAPQQLQPQHPKWPLS